MPAGKAGTINTAISDPWLKLTATGVIAKPFTEKATKVADGLLANPEPTTVTYVPTAATDGITTLRVAAPVFVKVAEAPGIDAAVIV